MRGYTQTKRKFRMTLTRKVEGKTANSVSNTINHVLGLLVNRVRALPWTTANNSRVMNQLLKAKFYITHPYVF